MATITGIKLYKADGYGVASGDEIQNAAGSNDLLGDVGQYPVIEERLGEIAKMSFTLTRGCEWHRDDLIKFRQRVYIEFSDSTVETFRIRKVTKNTNGKEDVKVECWALWADLAQTYVKYILAPEAKVSYQVPLTGVTFSNAVNNIVFGADYGINSFFEVDTIDASVSSETVNISIDSSTHLDLLYRLCESAGAEFSVAYDTGTNKLQFSFDDEIGSGTAGASTRPVHTGAAAASNRISLAIRDENPDYYSRLIPVGGSNDERITVGGAVFDVQSVALKTGTRYWVEFEAGVLYDDEMFDVSGSRYFYIVTDLGATTYQIYSVDSANNRIEVEGDPTGAATATFYVNEDSDGAELTYIPNKASEDDYGVVEKEIQFTDVIPYDNLFETLTADGAGDMSSGATDGDGNWIPNGLNLRSAYVHLTVVSTDNVVSGSDRLPQTITVDGDYTSEIGSGDTVEIYGVADTTNGSYTVSGTPTLVSGDTVITTTVAGTTTGSGSGGTLIYDANPVTAESTDAYRVKYGTSSVKVTCAVAGQGLYSDDMSLAPTTIDPYFSVFASVSVESGAVRVTVEDSSAVIHPTGVDQAESASDATYSLKIGGIEPASGNAHIEIRAIEAGTVFYLDALTFTQSPTPWEYSPIMGRVALWKDAVVEMQESGGYQNPILSGDFWDVSELGEPGSWNAVQLGDYVQVRDLDDGAGAYALSYNARVQAIKRFPDSRWGEIRKQVSLTRKPNTLARQLRPKTTRRISPSQSPIVQRVGQQALPLVEAVTSLSSRDEATVFCNDPKTGGLFKKNTSLSASSSDGVLSYASADGYAYERVDASYVLAEWAGATGDGTTDDTAAIAKALQVAIDNSMRFTFGGGRYKVTSTIWEGGSVSNVPVFHIDGGSGAQSTILWEPGGSDVMIDIDTRHDHTIIENLNVEGDSNGIALRIGSSGATSTTSSTRGVVSNVRIDSTGTCIQFLHGWEWSFIDCFLRNSTTGFDAETAEETNIINFRGGEAAGNTTGMRIASDIGAAPINLWSFLFEDNTTGLSIGGQDAMVLLKGCHFENNSSYHMIAGGTSGDLVRMVTMEDCKLVGNSSLVVFDRVQHAHVGPNRANEGFAQFRFTENCVFRSMGRQRPVGTIAAFAEHIREESMGQTAFAFCGSNFSELASADFPASSGTKLALDPAGYGQVYALNASLSEETSDFQTGTRAVYTGGSGTSPRLAIDVNVANRDADYALRYLQGDWLSLAYGIKFDASATQIYMEFYAEWWDGSSYTTTLIRTYGPDTSSDDPMMGGWMRGQIELDMTGIHALTNYERVSGILVRIFPVVGAAGANDVVYLDEFKLFNARFPLTNYVDGQDALMYPGLSRPYQVASSKYYRLGDGGVQLTAAYVDSSDPSTSDDEDAGYRAGDIGYNTSTKEVFVCEDASSGAAVWESDIVLEGLTVDGSSYPIKVKGTTPTVGYYLPGAPSTIRGRVGHAGGDSAFYIDNSLNSGGLITIIAGQGSELRLEGVRTKLIPTQASEDTTLAFDNESLTTQARVVWNRSASTLDFYYGTTRCLRINATGFGLYSGSPRAQASAIGKLTDSTGGSTDGTLSAVSGSGDDTNINNNFAELDAKIDALIDAIGASAGIGITAD